MDKGGRLGREHCGRHSRQSRWCCEPGDSRDGGERWTKGRRGAGREKRNDLYGDTRDYQRH